MTRNMQLAAWGFALFAVALAVAFGPLVAGYVFAGAALALMFALMVMRAARAIGDWGLGHGWTFHRRPRHVAHKDRRAA